MSKTDLYGLVLAGGRSTRMGTDKGKIIYHNIPQRQHTYKLLDEVCDAVFYSVREDQKLEFEDHSKLIIDQDYYRGPFNGILSAHHKFPDVAWLVLATDLPLIQRKDLEFIINNRDSRKLATAYASESSKLPEPLVAIWEPEGLNNSKEYLKSNSTSCPRKYLINSNIKLIFPEDDNILTNANTEDELKLAKLQIQDK